MLEMLCKMRTFSLWSHVSQTSASAVMSFVSSVESQQNPASGPVFFAVGTDFSRPSTFLWSVFSMPKGGAPRTGVADEEVIAETVVRVDSTEEGPGTGREGRRRGREEGPGVGRECDTESIDIDKCRELVMGHCHTIVEIDI